MYINEYYASCPSSYTDELMHYGVLGMKWGRHRVKSEQKFASKLMKRREKKVLKTEKKFNKIQSENKKAQSKGKEGNTYKAQKVESKMIKAKRKLNATSKVTTNRIKKTESYYDLKNKAIKDPSIKKSPEYKTARGEYVSMRLKDYGAMQISVPGLGRRLHTGIATSVTVSQDDQKY